MKTSLPSILSSFNYIKFSFPIPEWNFGTRLEVKQTNNIEIGGTMQNYNMYLEITSSFLQR